MRPWLARCLQIIEDLLHFPAVQHAGADQQQPSAVQNLLRGLLGPSERKSLQPMAACLGLSGHDQLERFIASPAWEDAPLWRVLAGQADRLVGGPQAVLVIDDTALPKEGTLSVGVERQYCGELGKQADCQSLVSLTLAGGEVPVPVGLRLFLPEKWTHDPERCAAAGVPKAEVVARS